MKFTLGGRPLKNLLVGCFRRGVFPCHARGVDCVGTGGEYVIGVVSPKRRERMSSSWEKDQAFAAPGGAGAPLFRRGGGKDIVPRVG